MEHNQSIGNARAQMRKGVLDLAVMAAASAGPIYASEMIDRLTEAKMIVVEGTLYPLLNRLKESGYLDYEWRESKEGPPRKYYLLTEKGRETLRELEEAWFELSGAVQEMIKKSKK